MEEIQTLLERERKRYDMVAGELARHTRLESAAQLMEWMDTDRNKLMTHFVEIDMHPQDAQRVYLALTNMMEMQKQYFIPLKNLNVLVREKPMWVRHALTFFWNGFEELGQEKELPLFYEIMSDIVNTLPQKQWRNVREYITVNHNNRSKAPVRFMKDAIAKKVALTGMIVDSTPTISLGSYDYDEKLGLLLKELYG